MISVRNNGAEEVNINIKIYRNTEIHEHDPVFGVNNLLFDSSNLDGKNDGHETHGRFLLPDSSSKHVCTVHFRSLSFRWIFSPDPS